MAMNNYERQKAHRARNAEEIEALLNAAKRMLVTFDELKWSNDENRKSNDKDCEQAASELHWRIKKVEERFSIKKT